MINVIFNNRIFLEGQWVSYPLLDGVCFKNGVWFDGAFFQADSLYADESDANVLIQADPSGIFLLPPADDLVAVMISEMTNEWSDPSLLVPCKLYDVQTWELSDSVTCVAAKVRNDNGSSINGFDYHCVVWLPNNDMTMAVELEIFWKFDLDDDDDGNLQSLLNKPFVRDFFEGIRWEDTWPGQSYHANSAEP